MGGSGGLPATPAEIHRRHLRVQRSRPGLLALVIDLPCHTGHDLTVEAGRGDSVWGNPIHSAGTDAADPREIAEVTRQDARYYLPPSSRRSSCGSASVVAGVGVSL